MKNKSHIVNRIKRVFLKEDRICDSQLISSLNDYRGMIQETNEILLPQRINEASITSRSSRYESVIWYISDMHIDQKIIDKYPTGCSNKKIKKFIDRIVDSLFTDYDNRDIWFTGTIIFCGDTSASFKINELFYTAFRKKIVEKNRHPKIFVILGNHEMWEFNSPEDTIYAYKKLFKSLDIILLNNSLYVNDPHIDESIVDETEREKLREKLSLISEGDLLKIPDKELQEICSQSRYMIWGGTGFAALQDYWNADLGLYKAAIKDREGEYKYSKCAEKSYEKIKNTLYESNVVVCSHMPLASWCNNEDCVPKWIYISGHTHSNHRIILDGEKCILSDNQIGYHNLKFKFKPYLISNRYDIFAYYNDGIYKITNSQYFLFYSGKVKPISSLDTRGCEKYSIYMLKKAGLYLFILESQPKHKLFLLEGGKKHSLDNSLEYYYENMVKFHEITKEATSGINKCLEDISKYIKSIGGNGNIHGSIVDIDWFNHVSIELQSGDVSYYWAASITERITYDSFEKLLEQGRPDLYNKYLDSSKNMPAILMTEKPVTKNNIIKIKASDLNNNQYSKMYRYSRILLKIQDISKHGIIRIWNEDIFNINKSDSKEISYIKEIPSKTNKKMLS